MQLAIALPALLVITAQGQQECKFLVPKDIIVQIALTDTLNVLLELIVLLEVLPQHLVQMVPTVQGL